MAQAQGWAYAVPHFRGCSGELNLGPRSYHSGDSEHCHIVLTESFRYAPASAVAPFASSCSSDTMPVTEAAYAGTSFLTPDMLGAAAIRALV